MSGLEWIPAAIGAASAAAGAGVAIDQANNPPKPPKIPDAPKAPDPRTPDRTLQQRAALRQNPSSTILGGYASSDANISRPTLLGGL